MVTPILLYWAEVWVIYEYTEVDKLQIKFYKQLLGVSKQTPNAAVYGELEPYPYINQIKKDQLCTGLR